LRCESGPSSGFQNILRRDVLKNSIKQREIVVFIKGIEGFDVFFVVATDVGVGLATTTYSPVKWQ
jgi:hypothetical protein